MKPVYNRTTVANFLKVGKPCMENGHRFPSLPIFKLFETFLKAVSNAYALLKLKQI